MLLGQVGRLVVDDATGSQPGLVDRVGGMTLGAVRVGLIATTLVLFFDLLAPPRCSAGIPDGFAVAAAVFNGRAAGRQVATA